MPRMSKIVPCVDCQEGFPRKQLNRMGRCSECAGAAVRDTITQLHNHEGPYYEKWQKALLAKIDRIKAGVEGGQSEAKES